MLSYYDLFGLKTDSGPKEITRAYRAFLKKNHPDQGGDHEVIKTAMKAYETLNDPHKKAAYDELLRGTRKPKPEQRAEPRPDPKPKPEPELEIRKEFSTQRTAMSRRVREIKREIERVLNKASKEGWAESNIVQDAIKSANDNIKHAAEAMRKAREYVESIEAGEEEVPAGREKRAKEEMREAHRHIAFADGGLRQIEILETTEDKVIRLLGVNEASADVVFSRLRNLKGYRPRAFGDLFDKLRDYEKHDPNNPNLEADSDPWGAAAEARADALKLWFRLEAETLKAKPRARSTIKPEPQLKPKSQPEIAPRLRAIIENHSWTIFATISALSFIGMLMVRLEAQGWPWRATKYEAMLGLSALFVGACLTFSLIVLLDLLKPKPETKSEEKSDWEASVSNVVIFATSPLIFVLALGAHSWRIKNIEEFAILAGVSLFLGAFASAATLIFAHILRWILKQTKGQAQ